MAVHDIRLHRLTAALCAVCLATAVPRSTAAGAQATPADPAFEVASIKTNRSSETGRSFRIEPGGTLRATNVTVRHLMWNAYGVQDFQIAGGPGWIGSDRYDITARADGNPTPDRLRAMMRRLLADRFRLDAERTTQQLPVYALVRVRAGGTLGPQLRTASGDCAGQQQARGCGATVGDGTLIGRGLTMARLAGELTGFVGRPVEDRTDLPGAFELELTWSPDPQAGDARPSIFAAVQEQLGLKLESTVGPVPVIVVRSVERPSED
jgi:uncharacterized protein (TIGR03435 family)